MRILLTYAQIRCYHKRMYNIPHLLYHKLWYVSRLDEKIAAIKEHYMSDCGIGIQTWLMRHPEETD